MPMYKFQRRAIVVFEYEVSADNILDAKKFISKINIEHSDAYFQTWYDGSFNLNKVEE